MKFNPFTGTFDFSGTSSGGTVTSVFGRTGAVVSATNDYTWAQLDKTTSNIADIATKSHTSLTDIGTNTHAQIDTALTRLANTSGTNTGDQTLSGLGGAPVASPFVTIGNDATLTRERALTGTTNQITITDNGANSTVVLSTPQNIDTAATPQFGQLGLGAASIANRTLNMLETVDIGASGVARGISNTVVDNSTVTNTHYIQGAYYNIITNLGSGINNTGYARGFNAEVYFGGDGTLAENTGAYVIAGTYNAGSDSTGTITNNYGLRIAGIKTASSTITNSYGMYVGSMFGTNKWGVYIDNTENNYFGGNVGIGTNNPGSIKLNVVGSDSAGIMLIAGATKGLRMGASSTTVNVDAVDNTGFASYQPLIIGGSTVGLAIAGTRKVLVDANGNVGINTSGPAALLDLFGTSGNGKFNMRLSGMTALGFTFPPTTDTYFNITNGNATTGGAQIDGYSSGNVAGYIFRGMIGATSPTVAPIAFKGYKYDGGTSVTTLASTEKVFSFFNGGTTEIATFLGSGNLGINATAPTNKLDTKASSTVGAAVFTGTGLNDATFGGTFIGGIGTTYTVTVDAVNGIKTSALNNGGTGYAINDTFTVDTGSTLATGKVLTLSGSAVATYSITSVGAGYTVANGVATTATSGGGSGLTINITALNDTFKWQKGSGTIITTISMTGAAQTLMTGVTVTFAAVTGHTLNDQWVSTTTVANPLRLLNAAGTQVMNMSQEGTLSIGTGTIVSGRQLTVAGTMTDSQTVYRGVELGLVANNTQASSNVDISGLYSNPIIGASNTQNNTSAIGFAGFTLDQRTTAGATGTITNTNGMYVIIRNAATGMTMTNCYGVRIDTNTNSGTMTNQAGLAVNSQTAATNNTYLLLGTTTIPAGNFGIYSSTANTNYFAGSIQLADKDLIFGTTTGTKIGTGTTQKLSFYGATPIVQITTGVAAATFVAGSGTAVNDASTFDGYTLKQVVKALRNFGLLA